MERERERESGQSHTKKKNSADKLLCELHGYVIVQEKRWGRKEEEEGEKLSVMGQKGKYGREMTLSQGNRMG